MDMFLLGLAVGAALAALLFGVMAVARAGSVGRAFLGLSVAGRASADPAFAAKLDELMDAASAPPKPTEPPKPSGEPLRLLALLQSEARLVDFLMEDISGANDAQVGQAVRDIHRKAQQAIKQHLTIEAVLPQTEGEQVTVQPGFDPSAVRVVGNVTGQPPFTGELQHPGWKVKDIRLPSRAEGQDLFVLQPAEVQLP
jgi:hypothetical protein